MPATTASVLDDLEARGLVQDTTDREGLAAALAAGPVTFYAGFDPSGVSLHAGSLIPIIVMRHLAAAGHRPLALLGGATGMIGDPSGKSEERRLLAADTLARNEAGVRAQLERLVPGAEIVNNRDWIGPMSFLEFLRDVGRYVTVNYMLAKESVRARLENRDQGISYTEFSYMLLQAYDFAYLARTKGCRLQLGGSDQWGNITTGIELARKSGALASGPGGAGGQGGAPSGAASGTAASGGAASGPAAGGDQEHGLFGLVSPLLMTASGQKFGKSEAGTSVWLDPELTSPYKFYQYWVNTEDADVGRYLAMFTFLPLDEIRAVVAEHDTDRARRFGQKRLAAEVTTWVHGAEAARRAMTASEVMFGGSLAGLTDDDLRSLAADLPTTELARAELEAGLPLVDLLVRAGLADSKGAARRLLGQGGVYLNNVRVDDPARTVGLGDLATATMLLLRAGKKNWHLVRVGAA